jgi:hypothetical protein
MPVVYSLTDLTGKRRNAERRMVVMTFEIKRRTFLVSSAAFAASLPVTGIVAMFFGTAALLVPPVFIGVALWLWDSRQRKGLKLHNYQAILDQTKAKDGVLYAAGQPVATPQLVMHQQNYVFVEPLREVEHHARGTNNLSSKRKPGSRKRQVSFI